MDDEDTMDTGADASESRAGYRRTMGRNEFQAAVAATIERAAIEGSLEMTWCDSNFAQWPLADPLLLANLARWSSPRRKLLMLAHDFEELPRRFPAFVKWRRQWSHIVDCRVPDDVVTSAAKTMLWVPGLECLKLADVDRLAGIVSSLPEDMNRVRESIEAVSQRSQPGFPATVLGL
jgi:hypothetical protein